MGTSTTPQCAPGQQSCTPGPSYQRSPASGPLASNLNLDYDDLIERIGMLDEKVYCYILTTVKGAGGTFE